MALHCRRTVTIVEIYDKDDQLRNLCSSPFVSIMLSSFSVHAKQRYQGPLSRTLSSVTFRQTPSSLWSQGVTGAGIGTGFANAVRVGIQTSRSVHGATTAATSDATAAFMSKHPALPTATLPKRGLVLSKLGFGAYRVNSSQSAHKAALVKALQAGVNVIDTSSHFGHGKKIDFARIFHSRKGD